MKRLLAVLMLIMPLGAEAATYSWTDASGTMHFTDDPGAVPKKFRKKARQVDGDAPAPAASPSTRAATEKQNIPAAARQTQPEAVPPAAPPAAAGAATRYGDRTAGEWQAEFRSMRKRLKEIEQQFEQARAEGGDGKTILRREKIEELNARNKKLNEEYEAVRLRFNQLAEQANKVGLPPEFAQ